MSFVNPTRSLKNANNVLFGLSMLSIFLMMIAGMPEHKSAAKEFVVNAAFYTWFGFLSLWVVSMLVGFAFSLLKKEGRLLLQVLRISCAAGTLHVMIVPVMFIVR